MPNESAPPETDFVAHTAQLRIGLYLLLDLIPIGISILVMVRYAWWIGLPLLLLTGGLFLFLLRRFLDPGEELRVNAGGIRVRRWSPQTIPWSEFDSILILYSKSQPYLCFVLRNPEQWRGPGLVAEARRIASWGDDFTISGDIMDRSFRDIVAAIERQWPVPIADW